MNIDELSEADLLARSKMLREQQWQLAQELMPCRADCPPDGRMVFSGAGNRENNFEPRR